MTQQLTKILGIPMFPNVGLPFTQGNIYHVKPSSGLDSNDGLSPDSALQTLARAQLLATADQNDIVLLYSESNSASSTTDYQSSTLDWAKDGVHLFGVCANSPMSLRSRVAFASTYDTAANLFTVSANNCIIANIAFYAGVAGTNPTGCMQVTGSRLYFQNCHIAGIGNDNNDIAGAYSLLVDGAEEVLFDHCNIGLNTVDAGTNANSEILFDSAAKNIFFENCKIYRRIEHATKHPLVKFADATSMDEIIEFKACGFISTSTNRAVNNASPFKFVATPTQGYVFIDPACYCYNGDTAGKWDVDDSNKILVTGSPTPAADTAQIGRLV